MEKKNATRLVADAILGEDYRTVIVAGKSYCILPPTIERIAGMAKHLSVFEDMNNVADIIDAMKNADSAAKALSWLIDGSEELYKELSKGSIQEVTEAIAIGFSLVSVQGFMKLSALTKNVAMLIATPKQQVTSACSDR